MIAAKRFDIRKVERHYSRDYLGAAVLDALVAAENDGGPLRARDLAPVDEFHVGGRRSTLELAGRIGLRKGMHVLDVGCGLGGAARFLATEFGCRVTGLDLSEKYCRIAAMLSRMLGIGEQTDFRRGNALEMPFGDATFDVLWTQHMAMNIPDKSRLYAEMRRVLQPGGVLALYDIVAGPAGAVHYPVPWATDSSISFLPSRRQLSEILEETGFDLLHFEDRTEAGRTSMEKAVARLDRGDLPPIGIHVLLGENFLETLRNLSRNLTEGRVALIEAVVRTPGVSSGPLPPETTKRRYER